MLSSIALFIADSLPLGLISFQFVPPVGRMCPSYFFNFYSVKNCKIAYNSNTTETGEKNKDRFQIYRILDIFDACLTKFRDTQILIYKLATDFSWQPSYCPSKTSPCVFVSSHWFGTDQCLKRERFVTQLCLQIWSGGTLVLLASPKWGHFGPVSLPPAWRHVLFTFRNN